MKTKISLLCICLTQLCLGASQFVMAQQSGPRFADQATGQRLSGQPGAGYTYQVFQAPNKMFGYDIYQNGKGIFHQPAAILPPANNAITQQAAGQKLPVVNEQHSAAEGFSKKEVAESAALLSIEKLKKRSVPVLTNIEVKQVITSTNSKTSIKH